MNTKTYKQAFVVLAVSIFIVPQIAFAAWWNPISWSIWNIFRPTPHTQQVQVATTTPAMVSTTTGLSETQKLKKEVSDLKKQLNTNGESTKNTGTATQPPPLIVNGTPPPPPAPVVQPQPQGIACNGKMWNACPSGKIFYCTATGGNCRNESDLLCNGKYWLNDCPSGTTFYCSTTGGDVSCKKNDVQAQNISPTSNQSISVDPMISLLDAEFKKQQAKNDEILRQMNIITAKYQPQLKILNDQWQSLIQQFGELPASSPERNQILLDEFKVSSQITNLQSQESAELNKIPGYSSIHVSSSASTIPPYDPSVSFITVSTPNGASTLQITSYQSGTYYVADTSTGKSYMISGGSGVYSVSPF